MNDTEALADLSVEQLMDAGIPRPTAYRVKAEGRIPSGKNGQLIQELIRDALQPSKNRSRSAHPGMLVPEHEMMPAEADAQWRIHRAGLQKAKRIEQERRNAEAEGRLVDVDVVRDRIAAAGVELLRGFENLRRSVETVCCPECRDAVVDAVSASTGDVARQIGKALAG